MSELDNPDGTTPLDADEREGLRFKHVSTRGELNQLEQANILEGMDWLKKQKPPAVLTEDFVRNLHQKLFGKVWKWAGSFRETEKNIGVDPLQVARILTRFNDPVGYKICFIREEFLAMSVFDENDSKTIRLLGIGAAGFFLFTVFLIVLSVQVGT